MERNYFDQVCSLLCRVKEQQTYEIEDSLVSWSGIKLIAALQSRVDLLVLKAAIDNMKKYVNRSETRIC